MADTDVVITDDTVVEIELPEGFVPDGVKPTNGAAAVAAPIITPVVTPAAAATPPPATEDATTALNKQLEDERQKRIAAESRERAATQRAEGDRRRAQVSEAAAEEARTSAASVQMQSVVGALDSAKRDMVAAKAAYKAAHEAGDADKMADTQEAMALAGASIRQFESQKNELEHAATRVAERSTATPAAPSGDPVENYLNNPGFSAEARNWLRQHPECLPPQLGGSDEKNAIMMAGHHKAKKMYGLDSPDYYRVIEEELGIRTPVSAAARTVPAGGSEGTVTPPPAPPRRQPIPSAAPTNEPPSATGQPNVNKSTFRLTPEMQDIAKISFPQKQGEDDRAWRQRAFANYAYNLAEATKEGKIGRTSH